MRHMKYLLAVFCAVLLFTQINCQRQKLNEKPEMPETASFSDESKMEENEVSVQEGNKPEKKETTGSSNFNGTYITAQLPQGFKIVEKQDGAGTPGQNIDYLVGGVQYQGLTQITILDPNGLDIVKVMAAYDTIDPSAITIPPKYDFVKDLSFTADGVQQNTYVVMEWFEGVAPEMLDQLDSILASIKVK
jgi:hypothetical protein